MRYYVFTDSNGRIVGHGTVQEGNEGLLIPPTSGTLYLDIPGNNARNQYVANGVLVDIPAQPASYYTFDWPTKTWVIPANALTDAQTARSSYIDAQLEIVIASSTVTYNGNSYQVDRVSSGLITSAVVAVGAGIPLPTGFVWRTSNNINVPFAQADLVALGGLALQNTNTLYAHSWAQKALINAATTIDAVNAITW